MRLSSLVTSLAGAAVLGLAALPATAGPVRTFARPPVQMNSSKLFNFNGRMVAGPFANAKLSQAWAHRLPAGLTRHQLYSNGKGKCKVLLFGSENLTGVLDQYCEDGAAGQVGTTVGAGGWGIAMSGNQMAVGVNGGTINVYSGLPTLGTPISLILSGQASGYNAYGVCFDDKGGLFATNWPGTNIDYFAPPLANGNHPTSTVVTNTGGSTNEVYYLACDFDKKETGNNGYLMAYSFVLDGVTDPATVGQVPQPYAGGSQALTVEQTLGSLGNGNGFPGGLAINKKDHLLANNQYGTLYDLGTKEPWSVPAAGSCTWGFNPNDFTNISWDNKSHEVWATDINFGAGLYTYLQSVGAPPLSGSCVTPGESGGPTFAIYNEEYLGVGVFKAPGM